MRHSLDFPLVLNISVTVECVEGVVAAFHNPSHPITIKPGLCRLSVWATHPKGVDCLGILCHMVA